MAKKLKNNFTKIDNIKAEADPNAFYSIAKAYTLTYSICYIVSPFFGLHIPMYELLTSAIFLVGIGAGLFLSVVTRNRYLITVLAVVEAIGCVAHFLKVIPWMPTFSDTAYIQMSILDLIQSVFLFKMLES